jgi:hypothetical protein
MKNYQTLTLIGSILGMITAVTFWIFASSFQPFITEFGSPKTVRENNEAMAYASVAVPFVIFLEIIALIFAFVVKAERLKIFGIFMIVLSVTVLIATSVYGVLPFALYLPAGIIALRTKPTIMGTEINR